MKVFIKSYGADIVRRASDGNVGSDVRYLFLSGEAQETGNFIDFTICFYETDSSDLGSVSPSSVGMNLPIRDYADMYHILQTEDLISAEYTADENNKLTWFSMGTNDRPIGQGFTNVP